MNDKDLRAERVSLLIGTIIGQLSETLNSIATIPMTNEMIYKRIFDIQNMAALQVHEIYYKGNKK